MPRSGCDITRSLVAEPYEGGIVAPESQAWRARILLLDECRVVGNDGNAPPSPACETGVLLLDESPSEILVGSRGLPPQSGFITRAAKSQSATKKRQTLPGLRHVTPALFF